MEKKSPGNSKKLLWRYPGWSEKDLEVILSPGHYLDIMPRRVYEPFVSKKVRKAKILGTHQGDLVLSLPRPPLPSPLLGQPLEITFLHMNQGRMRRFGYYTLILDLFDAFDYPNGSDKPALVVLFPREKDIAPTNLRTIRRFKPPKAGLLKLEVDDIQNPEIEDISFKGLRFSYSKGKEPGLIQGKIEMTLHFNEKVSKLSGRITHVNKLSDHFEVSVELVPMGLGLWSDLLVVLHGVEINL